MDASPILHIPDWVQTYAAAAMAAYPAKFSVEVLKQGGKLVCDKIQSWAKSQFGEKGSVTKSLSSVWANPDDRQAQERLIKDLQDDADTEQLQALHTLIKELKPYISADIKIHGDSNLTAVGNVHAPIAKDIQQGSNSTFYQAGRDLHQTINNPAEVKKNV